ncbi:dystrotelin [Heteronotia binoei]|uniref:dystrotelin n=1 Tax=Heteronotia binoei TaxID=13085 RepID=UPI002931AD09|nr:dystrotelin [Heteronotia binoei]
MTGVEFGEIFEASSVGSRVHLSNVSLIHRVLPIRQCQTETQSSLPPQRLLVLLKELFERVRLETPGQLEPKAPELTLSLLTAAYDRNGRGLIQPRSAATALIVLSGDSLVTKYRGQGTLFLCLLPGGLCRDCSNAAFSPSFQILAAVGENCNLNYVETATLGCFSGVLTAAIGEERFLSWLQTQPAILLWLPACYRLSVTEMVAHQVKCNICKTFPIIGLRYQCLKCLNFDICQVCFFTGQMSKPHKMSHPVMEHCMPVSAKKNTKLFFRTIRNNLFQGRCKRKEARRRKALMVTGEGDVPSHNAALYLRKQLNRWKGKAQLLHSGQEDSNHRLQAKIQDLIASQECLIVELQKVKQEIKNITKCKEEPLKARRFPNGPGCSLLIPSRSGYSSDKSLDPTSACLKRNWPVDPHTGLFSRNLESLMVPPRTEPFQSAKPEEEDHRQRPGARSVPLMPEMSHPNQSQITSPRSSAAQEPPLREEEEEELQQLMLKLKDALSLQVQPDQRSALQEELLSAAEHVSKSFSSLISRVSLPARKCQYAAAYFPA